MPDTLQIVGMYEYTEADPAREPEATHIEVVPPLDYRAVLVSKDSEGNIQLAPDVATMSEMYKHEYNFIRQQRNDLLYKSDWTCSVTDSPLTAEQKEAWASYRQQLRDLDIEGVSPINFTWPTPPQ